MESSCAGCLSTIPNREYLVCSRCQDKYDLDCANVSWQRFHNTMTKERKQSWICQACSCKKPKGDNTNTPIRPIHLSTSASTYNTDNENVTIRKLNTIPRRDTLDSNDISSLGNDTEYECFESSKNKTISINYFELESMLDRKFEKVKQSLISELKSSFLSEITKTITTELKFEINQETKSLHIAQENLERRIKQINTKITNLEIENNTLKAEIKILNSSNNNTQVDVHSYNSDKLSTAQIISEIENKRKIVIYGFNEYPKETERELYGRVTAAFYDILKINLTGYIECITRMGKSGKRRPLVVDMLSRKMTEHILKNSHRFNNTGLAINSYLGEKSRKERRILIDILIAARKNGCHANIINNKLFINGKEHTPINQTTIVSGSSPHSNSSAAMNPGFTLNQTTLSTNSACSDEQTSLSLPPRCPSTSKNNNFRRSQ